MAMNTAGAEGLAKAPLSLNETRIFGAGAHFSAGSGAGSVQDSKTLWVTELAKVGQPEHIISRRTDRLDGIATVHSH